MKKILACVAVLALGFGYCSVNAEEITLTPREEIIKTILKKNYEYNEMGLWKAIKDGNSDCVSLFLASGMDPNTTILKLPAIYWAIKFNKANIVNKFLDAGVDPNQEINGKSLIAHAILVENSEMVKSLLNRGAKINDMSAGKSLLALALTKKNDNITKILINNGAYVDEEALSKALKLNNNTLKKLILTNYKKQG